MFSALYLFAYLSLGSVDIALGAVATAKSLMFALNLGAAMIGALSLGALVLLMFPESMASCCDSPTD
jgi:hypothetical protein